MTDLLVISFIVAAIASLALTLTGFGYAMVSVPLLALFTDPVTAVVATTLVSGIMSAAVATRDRTEMRTGIATRFTIAAVLGMPIGLILLSKLDERILTFWIGIGLVLILIVLSLNVTLSPGPRMRFGAGMLSGALLTSTGMNGPPAVLTVNALGLSPRSTRATLQVIFVAQDVVAVAAFAALGLLTWNTLAVVGVSLAGLPIGWVLGERIFSRMSGAHFQRAVQLMLFATAAVTLFNAAAF